MRVVSNLAYIKKRETLGRRLFLIAVLSLGSGLLVSFTPNMESFRAAAANNVVARVLTENYAIFSFASLIIGFLSASVGSFFINRFAPRRWPNSKVMARPDEVFVRLLKGLNDQYTLYNWVIPGVSHLLVGPCGILTFVLRSDKGRLQVTGKKWREPFTVGRLFTLFAREGVGNPPQEIAENLKAMTEVRDEMAQGSDAFADYGQIPIQGAAAFVHEELALTVQEPTVRVLLPKAILSYVHEQTRAARVKNSLMRRFTQDLEAQLQTAGISTEPETDAAEAS